MTSALQKANVAVQFLQHNFPNIAAQLLFFACGMLQGWGLEGWCLGVAEPPLKILRDLFW